MQLPLCGIVVPALCTDSMDTRVDTEGTAKIDLCFVKKIKKGHFWVAEL